MSETPHYLIVGQGIAGTVLAWTLRAAGARVTLADATLPDASSPLAAGIVNPVTGRRLVKSWKIDDLLPFAHHFYETLSETLGIPLWYNRPLLRLLDSPQETNDWASRSALPDYAPYLEAEAAPDPHWKPLLHPRFAFGGVKQAARVDVEQLLLLTRTLAIQQGWFIEKKILSEEIKTLTKKYEGVIFCEGHWVTQNVYFHHLPWRPNKGQALLLDIPAARGTRPMAMLKKQVLITPLENGLFWAGATNEEHALEPGPTPEGLELLVSQVRQILAVPFEVVAHRAAVRPGVSDRRPVLGCHPDHPKIGVFNGLGAKGASLAPLLAAQLAAHLLENKPLEPSTDLRRFLF